jgi:hypothetical protein
VDEFVQPDEIVMGDHLMRERNADSVETHGLLELGKVEFGWVHPVTYKATSICFKSIEIDATDRMKIGGDSKSSPDHAKKIFNVHVGFGV